MEYIKHPFTIGAIAPSGRNLARKMIKPIDFSTAKVIAEYGPGTGSFSRELVAHRKEETVLLLIEQNECFCRHLERIYGTVPNLHVIHGNAEDIGIYLKKYGYEHCDYIVSGLPFTTLPMKISHNLLVATKNVLEEDGVFITFQYSLVKRKFFEQYFRITHRDREWRNIPPAHVLVMKKKPV